MDGPWLSVVMPCRDGERWVGEALDSLCGQGEGLAELIVVDDGSRDRTLEVVESFRDRLPLSIVRGPRLGNWVAATNRGLALARGEYLGLLHQDDVWRPGRLRALESCLREHPRLALLVHPVDLLDAAGRTVGRWRCPLPADLPLPPEKVLPRLLVQNFIAIVAPVFPRRLLGEGLDESLWYTADWDLWLRLAALGPVLHTRRPLAGFRLHPASLTARGSASSEDFRAQIETVSRRHLERHRAGAAGAGAVRRAARLSIEVNVALAALAHRRRPPWARLAAAAAAAGPAGLLRFFRDSRIVERVWARLRVGLGRRRQE